MKNLLILAALCCSSVAFATGTAIFPNQCNNALDTTAVVCSGQRTGAGNGGVVVLNPGVCSVPTIPTGGTKGICAAPLQTPPAWPNSSQNDHLKTAGGEGHAQGYYNGCASGYADLLQTFGGVDAGAGCCSSITKVVDQDVTNGNHFVYVGEACDPTRGSGGSTGSIKDCCGGPIPLSCQATGPKANTCCIPTGSAGPAMSTGYQDPMPGWCCSGYASTNGSNTCLASPDGGNGGCQVTGCDTGYCDSHTGNCTPLALGEPCLQKQDGTYYQLGWPHGGVTTFGFGGEPSQNCAGGSPYGFCGYITSHIACGFDPVAKCCLMRDLQGAVPFDGGPVTYPCTQNTDCCNGSCNVANGQCAQSAARQPCYDDGDCSSGGFGDCMWQNGGWCR